MGQAVDLMPLLTKTTGLVVSISTTPSGSTLQNASVMDTPDKPRLPIAVRMFLDATDALRRLRARFYSVSYKYLFLDPNGKDLATLGEAMTEGKLRPIVGSRVDMRDIEKVREACWQSYKGKGGLGKTVFEIKEEA